MIGFHLSVHSRANGVWMSQVGHHVTDAVEGGLNGRRFLIHDRDPLFRAKFQSILTSGRRVRQVAATMTESKCPCRTVCEINQGIVSEPVLYCLATIRSAEPFESSNALSPREESSGAWESADCSYLRAVSHRIALPPPTPGWHVELALSFRSLISIAF